MNILAGTSTCFFFSPPPGYSLGGLTGRSWPLMVLPKKEILSVASPPVSPSDELGLQYRHRRHYLFLSRPPHRPVAPETSSNPLLPGFLTTRFERHKGLPRNDPTTGRSARAHISRLRAQFSLLDTHRISPHLRPAFVAMCSVHVLSVVTRGEVLAPL